MKNLEKNVMVTKGTTLNEKEYKLNAFDLDAVEELETAIAPGGFGFGCGCNGIFGAYCG